MSSPPLGGSPPATPRLTAAVLLVVFGASCTSETTQPEAGPAPQTTPAPSQPGTSPESQPSPGQTKQATAEVVTLRTRRNRRTASGRVPAYVALDAASVKGAPDHVEFVAVLPKRVPSAMPDEETRMRLTFTVLIDDTHRYELAAQASETGWTSIGSGSDGNFPTSLAIGDRDIRITVDWQSLGGPRPFRWLATVAWASGGSHGFDSLPESGFARFP